MSFTNHCDMGTLSGATLQAGPAAGKNKPPTVGRNGLSGAAENVASSQQEPPLSLSTRPRSCIFRILCRLLCIRPAGALVQEPASSRQILHAPRLPVSAQPSERPQQKQHTTLRSAGDETATASPATIAPMLSAHPIALFGSVIVDWKGQQAFLQHHCAETGSDVTTGQSTQSINLYGNDYALRGMDDSRYSKLTDMQQLYTDELPVYRERLSRQWHSAVRHAQNVFIGKEVALIRKIKIVPNDRQVFSPLNNAFPEKYGDGKIYVVTQSQDAVAERQLLRVIEMFGELVPVRLSAKGPQSYEVYQQENPKKSGNLVEWDGVRWTFLRRTTQQLSNSLREKIDGKFRACGKQSNVSAQQLYAPDENGIRWHKQEKNHGYIKLNNAFVYIERQQGGRTTFMIPQENGRIDAAYERGVLHWRRVVQHDDLRRSNNSLAQQREHANATHFAQSQRSATANVGSTNGLLGNKIKDTWHGPVFDDPQHAGRVIKQFNTVIATAWSDADPENVPRQRYLELQERVTLACKEAALFNRYYGKDAAEVLVRDDQVYLKMDRVPGIPLSQLAPGALPPKAQQELCNLQSRLRKCGIWHGDVQMQGIQYFEKHGLFYPSDFSRNINKYIYGMAAPGESAKSDEQQVWQPTFDLIERKLAQATMSIDEAFTQILDEGQSKSSDSATDSLRSRSQSRTPSPAHSPVARQAVSR